MLTIVIAAVAVYTYVNTQEAPAYTPPMTTGERTTHTAPIGSSEVITHTSPTTSYPNLTHTAPMGGSQDSFEFTHTSPLTTDEAQILVLKAKTKSQISDILDRIAGIQASLDVHQQRLRDYMADPDAKDNLGFLSNPVNESRREQIIASRIRRLQGQIDNFQNQIDELQERLRQLRS